MSSQGRRQESACLASGHARGTPDHPPQPCPLAPLQNRVPEEGGEQHEFSKSLRKVLLKSALSFPTCKVRC